MTKFAISSKDFLADRQGRTFADVVTESTQPFERVLAFFSDPDRQRRMEESETHHDRPPLAGVVRELEADSIIGTFLSSEAAERTKRLRQAVGVVVRMIMERRGWRKSGRKGSLGVRDASASKVRSMGVPLNTGGLACWFLRAERYELREGMPFRTVRDRCRDVPQGTSPVKV